jgi:tRNA (mo5U34)-methyltransferase
MDRPKNSTREIKERINAYSNWYHQIELAPGVVTPGINDSVGTLGILDNLGLPKDMSGLRVLNIGCRDGFFTFEVARRGADVVGIDYAAPEVTGFNIAADILGYRASCLVENIYDLSSSVHGKFDVVLFLGVLYHLRNPLLAIDTIRQVMDEDGMLFVETQLATDVDIAQSKVPVWQFYPGDSLNDDSNKWAPNMSGLRAVVSECQFDVLKEDSSVDRGCVFARATTDKGKDFVRQLDTSKGWYGTGR